MPDTLPVSSLPTQGALLQSAVRIAGLGLWTWDLATGSLALSAEAQRIFDNDCLDGTFASWLRCLDAADAKALGDIEDQVSAGQRTFSFEYHFARRDGSRKRLKSDGEVVSLGVHGQPLVLAGTVLELGEPAPCDARRATGTVTRVPPSHPWTWEQDASYRFTRMEVGDEALVPELSQAIGLRRWELAHAAPLDSTWQQHVRDLESRVPFTGFEYRIGNGPGAIYVSVSGEPVHDASGQFCGYRGTARSITRRVRAEEQGRHARLLLEQASRLGRLGAWALHVPSMDVEWTSGSERLVGSPGVARPTWQQALAMLAEPGRSQLARCLGDCLVDGQPFSVEVRRLDEAGAPAWLRISGEPEPSITGAPRRVIGLVQDISEAKDHARRAQDLNERLTATLESITDGFYTLDRELRFTYVNHVTERVAQRARGELLGHCVLELFPWIAGSRFEQEYAKAMATGRASHFEAYAQLLGVWVEAYVYPSAQGLSVYFQDITERKRAQDALRASEERHRLLFQVSHDGILQLEHESGRIVAANPAACDMFRLTEAGIRARGRAGLVAPGESRSETLLAEVDRTGRGRGMLRLVRGDGTQFDAELAGAIFRGTDGIVYASVAIRDVSESLRHQAEIMALNQGLALKVQARTAELEAANADLKAFAHSLAHDLRTPIAAMNALGHVLEERLQSASERDRIYATRIRQAALQLDEYVEALLTQARISQASLRAERVDLSAMATAILEDLHVMHPHRRVTTHVQPGMEARGDAALLRMALENLLGNAWKFTANREDAEIRFVAEPQEDGSVAYGVIDNGAGFDMDYAHKLFGTFQRLHTQAEFPGTGVGLANVQRVIARHGGRVWAHSRRGAGAAFHFTLAQDRSMQA